MNTVTKDSLKKSDDLRGGEYIEELSGLERNLRGLWRRSLPSSPN